MKKPSEMTNDELALELMSRVPLDSNRHDDIREAAFRLKKQVTLDADLLSAHKREVDDLAFEVCQLTAERNIWAERCKTKDCEIERLNAAIKPVLSVDPKNDANKTASICISAVADAIRIFRETRRGTGEIASLRSIVKELSAALNDANAQLCKGEYCAKTTCCSECKASKNRSLIAKAWETLDEK